MKDTRNNRKVLAFLRDHQHEMVTLLTQLINLESPTDHKPSLDLLGAFLAKELQGLGAQVEILPETQVGNHVRACWGEGEGGSLLLCHMDTVWDIGTVIERPVRIEDGRLYGPGAEDMKGGIVVAIWAIRALLELSILPERPIMLLLNSDEETGSKTSRPIIETEAGKHEVVFVLEPAQAPNGSFNTSRKGVGRFLISVTGQAAHAGADHEKGINAIDELAFQILTIRSFTDYARGTTFNVGMVGGGTRSNVVPAKAWAQVDVRAAYAEEIARVLTKMKSLKAKLPGAYVEVTGGFHRPPMERTPSIAALYARAESLAAGMGLQISEAGAGSASDGNITAVLGVPTLDGLGVVGDGEHSINEFAIIASMPERAALLAALLAEQ
jgi:glutamate carboxypeptidase